MISQPTFVIVKYSVSEHDLMKSFESSEIGNILLFFLKYIFLNFTIKILPDKKQTRKNSEKETSFTL